MRKAAIILLTAACLGGVTFAGAAGASTGNSAKVDHLHYVALGDSYSAAAGNIPPAPDAPADCVRSSVNYPHILAHRIHAYLRDVTCSAAKTSDFFSSQYPDVKPQLDALSTKTQLVTMTIGGNDSNVFIDSIVECGAAGATTAGTGHPCKDRYGDSFDNTIRTTTYPALVKALSAVHRHAPNARVAILSYPWILPKTTGCYPTEPVATGDVPYLREEQATLNLAVHRAARATHSIYVDLNKVSNGHDACKPIGVRWVEPVVGGTNPVVEHPNALGERMMAAQAMKVLHLH